MLYNVLVIERHDTRKNEVMIMESRFEYLVSMIVGTVYSKEQLEKICKQVETYKVNGELSVNETVILCNMISRMFRIFEGRERY